MHEIELMKPYGIIVQRTGEKASIESFSQEQIYEWISKHRIIVFRGFEQLPKKDFALYAQTLGEPLQWIFGAINELKVKADAKNYIYTDRAVPFHWDGAFIGKIPFVILFQCITAPSPLDKGGTTFVDTIKLLAETAPEKIAEWRNITITYRTEKIVHYGGKIVQPLIARHPVTHEEVIRFAEPVADINPVWLEVHGYTEEQQAAFINEMQNLLYDPKYYYVHEWKDGDIVFADNHAMLHGREAFLKANERYIQRINVLEPKKDSIRIFIKRSLTIRRKEFFVAELPIFLIPVLLCVADWQVFANINFWMGIAAGLLLFNIGDMINCYADRELDAVYKSHLSYAVSKLGKRNIMLQIVLSAVVAMILTTIIAFNTQQLYLIPLTLAGGFIGLQYSISPFHFKNRGGWQLLCLWGIIFFGPMLYTAIIANGFPPLALLALFSAYGFHQMGIILLNTAEDYTEDKQAGLKTIIVWMGLHKAMHFALWLIVISGIAMQAAFFHLFRIYALPMYLYPGILVLTLAWLYIVIGFRKIVLKLAGKNEADATEEIKKNGAKVPEWLKMGAYASLAVALILFVYRIYFRHLS